MTTTACYLCEGGDGTFPHADKDTGPLGLACPSCHQIVILAGEDPAAIDTGRLAARLRTIADNRQRADMTHDHDRPDTADMRAALATARAILDGASHGTTHQAAEGGSCAACAAAGRDLVRDHDGLHGGRGRGVRVRAGARRPARRSWTPPRRSSAARATDLELAGRGGLRWASMPARRDAAGSRWPNPGAPRGVMPRPGPARSVMRR